MWKCSYSCSSVGLAKAALEAINGFNLFGNQVQTFTCVSSSRFLMSEDFIDCRFPLWKLLPGGTEVDAKIKATAIK